MTKEEKQLLLKDLCARIPYGVKCNAVLKQIDGSLKSVFGTFKGYNGWATVDYNLVDIKTVRPYLRPLSSMNEEEKEELYHYYCNEIADNLNTSNLTWEVRCCVSNSFGTDWLNAHHFDYCGLIPMGLAFEAEEWMYKK